MRRLETPGWPDIPRRRATQILFSRRDPALETRPAPLAAEPRLGDIRPRLRASHVAPRAGDEWPGAADAKARVPSV